MKSYTLRFRQQDKRNFDELQRGEKSVETRAGTVKYRLIEVGDTLVFVCGNEKFSKKIVEKYHWESIDAMVRDIPFRHVMPSVESVEEMKKIYASYPGYEEKIKEHGLLGWKLA